MTEYAYDGDGNVLSAETASTAVNKLWDVNHELPQLALERDGTDDHLRRYVTGLDTIGFADPSEDDFYYHSDAFGSVANVTDAAGDPQWTYAYEPFGSARSTVQNDAQAPVNLLRFGGEYVEPTTTLLNLRARRYDPGIGRFLSQDPLTPGIGSPQVSAYAYVDGRPTLYADPSGMSFGCFFDLCNVAKNLGSGVKGVGGTIYDVNSATYGALLNPLETRDAIYSGLMSLQDTYHRDGFWAALGAAGDPLVWQPIKRCLNAATSTDVERSARSCTKVLVGLIPAGRVAMLARPAALLAATRAMGAGTRGQLPRVIADETGSVRPLARPGVDSTGTRVAEGGAISMDEAVARGVAHVGGRGEMVATHRGNYQFIGEEFTNADGNRQRNIARFDLENLRPGEVPHLNLEIQINGVPQPRLDPHTPVIPSTIRPGDSP